MPGWNSGTSRSCVQAERFSLGSPRGFPASWIFLTTDFHSNWYNPDVLPGLLGLSEELVKTVPVCELAFRPDDSVADVIREFATTTP